MSWVFLSPEKCLGRPFQRLQNISLQGFSPESHFSFVEHLSDLPVTFYSKLCCEELLRAKSLSTSPATPRGWIPTGTITESEDLNIFEVINTFGQAVPTGRAPVLKTANFQSGSALWSEVGEPVTIS